MKRVAIYSYHIYEWVAKGLEQAVGGAQYQLLTLGQRHSRLGYHASFLLGGWVRWPAVSATTCDIACQREITVAS